MAAATATVTITAADNTQGLEHVFGTIAISASPATYTTGGIPVSFAGFDQIKSGSVPLRVYAISQRTAASPGTALFEYGFCPGTTLANGTIQVFTGAAAQAGLTELSAAAIPAGVSGDTIVFEALFSRI